MKNAVFTFPVPANEPVKSYLKGSPERVALEAELKRQSGIELDIPLIIGGKEVRTGNTGKVVMPHDHGHVLATYHKAGPEEVKMAIKAALDAHDEWAELDWTVRASIILKIADLLAGKYRAVINAACMLGQSKNFYQAEIDSACETIDFLRYNAAFASKIYGIQPKSGPNQINSVEYRPLEGFIFALTPFNFTSIASNLSMSPALMGNTVVWKPSTTAILSNYYLMKIYEEAEDLRGGRSARRRGELHSRQRRCHRQGDLRFEGPRRSAFYRLQRHLQHPLETGGREYRQLPLLSPLSGRDRRQGLYFRASLGCG